MNKELEREFEEIRKDFRVNLFNPIDKEEIKQRSCSGCGIIIKYGLSCMNCKRIKEND